MNSTATLEETIATGASPLQDATFAAAQAAALEPSWLIERRRVAWEFVRTRLDQAGSRLAVPAKDEKWRFSGERGWVMADARLEPASGSVAPSGAFADAVKQLPAAANLIFEDGQLASRATLPVELSRKGVIFLPLAEAIRLHPELLREHLFQHDRALGGDIFLKLHQAYARTGAFLFVPDGVEIAETFIAAHGASTTGLTLFPHTLIVAGRNAVVNFLDYYGNGPAAGETWVAGASTVMAGPGAKVFRKSVQNLNLESHSFQVDTTAGDRDADVKNISVHLGARRARFENQVRLLGSGAHLKLYALTIADGQQEFDQRTFQDHVAPHTTSDLLYKNALLDEARTIFAGMIRVERDAAETDAYQQNRNLLLNAAAEANSLPGLEIMNNNVRCTHGATTSRLDPEELFYLRSRGISRQIAYQLLVFGFFEEVIQKVENENLAELLRQLVREKFSK
jgi:Fe-S cluster assembly protein SufD